jgi:hypothetical protein
MENAFVAELPEWPINQEQVLTICATHAPSCSEVPTRPIAYPIFGSGLDGIQSSTTVTESVKPRSSPSHNIIGVFKHLTPVADRDHA